MGLLYSKVLSIGTPKGPVPLCLNEFFSRGKGDILSSFMMVESLCTGVNPTLYFPTETGDLESLDKRSYLFHMMGTVAFCGKSEPLVLRYTSLLRTSYCVP